MRGREISLLVFRLCTSPRPIKRAAFGLNDTLVARDVVAQLDSLPRGATAISDFSPQIEEAIEKTYPANGVYKCPPHAPEPSRGVRLPRAAKSAAPIRYGS